YNDANYLALLAVPPRSTTVAQLKLGAQPRRRGRADVPPRSTTVAQLKRDDTLQPIQRRLGPSTVHDRGPIEATVAPAGSSGRGAVPPRSTTVAQLKPPRCGTRPPRPAVSLHGPRPWPN